MIFRKTTCVHNAILPFNNCGLICTLYSCMYIYITTSGIMCILCLVLDLHLGDAHVVLVDDVVSRLEGEDMVGSSKTRGWVLVLC